jgi:hypothetical protein
MSESEFLRTAALVTAAALRDDTTAVRLLLRTLPPERIAATAEGSVIAMAGLVREVVTPEALARAITEAQQVAHEAATEGAPS